MRQQRNRYRKNYFLVFAFIVVLTISMVVAMILASNLITNNVENEFSSRKVEVLEHNLYTFNDFFQNRIPEISFYQGYLDSATASVYSENILRRYPFVEKIIFYDVILNDELSTQYGFTLNNLIIYPTGVFQFELEDQALDFPAMNHQKLKHSSLVLDDFNTMAVKFASFVERADTTRVLYDDEIFKVFYSVTPGKISYMNIPRRDDLRIYKELMTNPTGRYTAYEQDMVTFFINPNKILLENTIPELYQNLVIQPLVFDMIGADGDLLTTEAPLPGALADYKLFLSSSSSFLNAEISQRLYPVWGGVLLIYVFLVMFAYLIYRNLYINKRLFKLQYDFINNLTHEFKTPVSVIKIAGNNIGNATQLSDKDRALYARILDQEADKLNNLMNTLLSFTQIENKVIKQKNVQVDLKALCQTIIGASKLKYPDMRFEYRVDVKETLFIDPVLLSSVFQNLIDNAYKYSKPETRSLMIHVYKHKAHIYMSFKDQGIGIAKEEVKHVFKKFYRVESQYNQQGSAGLGLAFCKEIVNFMGGSMTVESEFGKGTTFLVIFPIES